MKVGKRHGLSSAWKNKQTVNCGYNLRRSLDTVAGVTDKAGSLVNPAVGTGGSTGGFGGLAGNGLLEALAGW